jgi:hypothetical protein
MSRSTAMSASTRIRVSPARARQQASEADEEGTAGDHRWVLELRTHRRRTEDPLLPSGGHIVFATVAGLRLVGGAVGPSRDAT